MEKDFKERIDHLHSFFGSLKNKDLRQQFFTHLDNITVIKNSDEKNKYLSLLERYILDKDI